MIRASISARNTPPSFADKRAELLAGLLDGPFADLLRRVAIIRRVCIIRFQNAGTKEYAEQSLGGNVVLQMLDFWLPCKQMQ